MSYVVVVGQGYVGLPLAMRAVGARHTVVGFDSDDRRIKQLACGLSYLEDVSDAQIQGALTTGRYRPSSDADSCDDFDVAVITVPTPLREGVPDLSFIEESAAVVAKRLRRGACVVLESTTYPGTTEELLVPILEAGSGLVAGDDFHVGYSPERIDPGNQTWGFSNIPKVVSGINDESLAAVQRFYGSLVERTVPVAGTREAEFVKLIENTFRHVNIALVNELAMFAGDMGISVWSALDAAATKPFGFMRFDPGPGVGGHCLPVDPSYLSWQAKRQVGETFRFVELANDVNDHMPAYVVRRLVIALNKRELAVRGRRILLVGMAYKANTGDVREAPSQAIARRLLALGAQVGAVDPYVDDERLDPRIRRADLTAEELATADAVVILAQHKVFDWALVRRHARYVLDTRHCLTGSQVEYL